MKKTLTVGEVSKRSGVAISTIHYYESIGLIHSFRNNGNQRRFYRDILRRISVIKVAKNLGMPLKEIKIAFKQLPAEDTPNKRDWEKLSRSWEFELQNRINKLVKLKDSLSQCIGCGCLSLTNCKLVNDMDILSQDSKIKGAILLE